MDDKGRIIYQTVYESPVGALTLTASEDALTALSFPQERYPEDVERLTKECEVCIPAADKIPGFDEKQGNGWIFTFQEKGRTLPRLWRRKEVNSERWSGRSC